MSMLTLTGSLTSTPDGVKVLTGADVSGTNDSSAAFQSAALAVASTGGTIFVRRGSYIAEDLPLDTGSPNFYPITWLGEGVEVCTITLPSSPSNPMFKLAQTGVHTGGGVIGFTLIGDGTADAGDVNQTPAKLKSATQHCMDLSSCSQVFRFKVDGCFIKNFKYGWLGGDSSRSPEFGNNHWWYNEVGVYTKLEHPLWTGVNDFRSNFIGIGGTSMFDCQVGGKQKFVRNHYGMKFDSFISSSIISGGFFFKNRKRGHLNNGGNNKVNSGCLFVPDDQIVISSITTSGDIVTVNTATVHFLETGEDVVHWDVTGLSLSIDETVYSATRVTDTQYTFDHGTTITGTASNGHMTGCMAGIEDTNGGLCVDDNIFRRDTANNRFGIADMYVNAPGASINRCNVRNNRFVASGNATLLALKQKAIAYNCTEWRSSIIANNNFYEIDIVLDQIGSSRFEQNVFSNNSCNFNDTSGLGSGEDIVDMSSSSFGNVITGNVFTSQSGFGGRYYMNVDLVRSAFTGNYIRYDASEFTAAINVVAVSSGNDDTVGATSSGTVTGTSDAAGVKGHNLVTSF